MTRRVPPGTKVWILPGRGGGRKKRARVVSHDPWTGRAEVRRRGRVRTVQACDLQFR